MFIYNLLLVSIDTSVRKMLTRTQIEIIGYLLGREEPQNIRGIARELGKSYTLVYNNIEDLRKKEIVYKQEIPPAQIIKLNERAPVKIFVKAENKKKETFLQKHKWMEVFLKDVLRSTKNVFFILMVFGSYAKDKTTEKSDLDLLAVVPGRDRIKETETALNRAYTKAKKQAIVVSQQDFREMIKKPGEFNVGNEAKKSHVILYGAEPYWQLIREGG